MWPHWLGRKVYREALSGIGAKPGRAFLTSLGVAAGVAVFVVTVGISDSASRTIIAQLAEASGTVVEIRASPAVRPGSLSDEAIDNLRRLDGVTSVAALASADEAVEVAFPGLGGGPQSVPLYAISADAGDALDLQMRSGRFYDSLAVNHSLPVAVLGSGAAARLQVRDLARAPTITVANDQLAVVGLIGEARQEPSLLNAVVIPGTLGPRFGITDIDRIVVRTTPRARDAIAKVAALAASPNHPQAIQVLVPAGEEELQRSISRDLNDLLLATAIATMVVGAVAVGNVMMMSTIERRGEIGLRRALGARRSHIAVQFLAEAAIIGAVGATLGTSIGVISVTVVATANQWIPSLPPETPILAVLGGVLVGTISGALPARRAANTEPIEALRAG